MNASVSKKSTACFCVLLVGCLALVWDAAAAGKPPKIVFKEDAHDFGKIKQGTNLAYEFVFKNDGDETLTIKNVETSCGCTAALVSDKKIPAGKSGKIKVTFNSQGYGGEVVKYIYVDSDDPAQPRVQLKIAAAVNVPPQPRIDFDRYNYDAGLLVEDEVMEAPILVKNRGELELQFECSLQNGRFWVAGKEAKFPLKVAAGKETEVTVKLPLADRIGMVREFVIFKTNDPMRSTLSVTLSGYAVTKDQLKQVFQKYKTILK